MMDLSIHYISGEEIHVGDQITLDGQRGEIAFVIGRNEYNDDFASQRNWYALEFKRGFMIRGGGLGLVLMEEANEDLEFIKRQTETDD